MRYAAGLICGLLGVKLMAVPLLLVGDPWCPVSCDPNSESPGYFIEIAKEIFNKEGIDVAYEAMPWSRALVETRSAKAAAVAGALKADAPDFIFPKQSFGVQKSCFFVNNDSQWKFKNKLSLEGVLLGLVKDYTYGEPLDSFVAAASTKASHKLDFITGTDTAKRLFLKLKNRRIDVMVEDESVASYVLQKNAEFQNVKFNKVHCMKANPLYVAFSPNSKDSKKYVDIIDKVYSGFKGGKKHQEILRKYGIQ